MFKPQPSAEPVAPEVAPMDAAVAPMVDSPEGEPVADMEGFSDADIEAHLDGLPDEEKKFLATHLTPEFVRAIGLISGPEVAQYLNQFADTSKVLVPVPRQVAEKFIAEQQAQQSQSAPQGSPSAPVGMAPSAPVAAAAPAAPTAPSPAPAMMAPPR